MAASIRRPFGRRGRDKALNYRVEYRYGRDASGRSVAFPDWPSAQDRRNEIAVVLHVSNRDELDPYLALLASQPTPFDLYVVSDIEIDSATDIPDDGVREFLVADSVADSLYQLTSLANSGRLSGYRTVLRHVHKSSTSSPDFEALLGPASLAELDHYVHKRLTHGGIVSKNLSPVVSELSVNRAIQLALRVSVRLPELEGELRSLSTFVLRGSLVESLCTLRLDHQDFYFDYLNYIDEGLASEHLGPVLADVYLGRAVELLYFHLLERADVVTEFASDLSEGWQSALSPNISYSMRTSVWALYHPDLTTRTSVRNASWSHIVGSMPMHFGQEMPLSPIDLNFSDPLAASDRAAQTSLARQYGVTGFLVAMRWNEDGLLPAEFVESLEAGEDFPWAALLFSPLEVRTDPLANHPRYSAPIDPGVKYYPAIADRVVAGFARGSYLRLDGRPVVLVQDLEMLVDPQSFVEQIRIAANAAGEEPWIGIVETYLTTALPGQGAYPPFVDGMIQLPPANAHHRRWARLLSRVNGFSGHAVDLNTRDTFAAALAGRDDEQVIPGAMVGYDSTPVLRSQGEVGYNWNVFTFRKAFDDAVRSVAWRDESHRIVAVNSWNGWSDLSQLEPSVQRRSSYLATMKDVLEYPAEP